MAPDTYGFGGAEPSREVPSRDGDATKSSTNDSPEPSGDLSYTRLDDEFTDNIRGQSPVDGLIEPLSEWETTSLHPSSEENVSSPSGAATGVGSWPLSSAPAPANVPGGAEDSDWTGHKPGKYGTGI